VQISEDQTSLIIRAVEHYAAYLRATNRDDHQYRDLAESLKRKSPATGRATPRSKQRRSIAQRRRR
jgi:hypothetical protein